MWTRDVLNVGLSPAKLIALVRSEGFGAGSGVEGDVTALASMVGRACGRGMCRMWA